MDILEMIQKYGQGKGEAKMWDSVAVLNDALLPMKETQKDEYWCVMRRMYGVIGDGHYNEEFAMYDVAAIEKRRLLECGASRGGYQELQIS